MSARSRDSRTTAAGTVGRASRRRARRALAGAATLLALVACAEREPAREKTTAPRPTARPSVVLVNVSGARYDAVVPGPGDTALLPSFATFAAGATTFTQAASAASWEAPALATVLTGMIPFDTNVKGRAGVDRPYLITPIETLAEMLHDHGYATAAFVTGRHVARPMGLDQGFDAWHEGLDLGMAPAAVSGWLAANATDKPFLLFVHLDATRPPPPSDVTDLAAWAATAYADRLRETDDVLATILRALESAPLPADTITILFSDHGEPRAMRPSGALRGADVGDDQVRVPLAIRAAALPRGRVDASCGLVDLLPTVREAMGLPPGSGLGGRSLLPLGRAPTAAGVPILVQAWRRTPSDAGPLEETLFGVRTARAKFVAVFTARPPAWTEAVYDLVQDPEERAPHPGAEAARFGPDFQKAVENVRDLLRGRRSHLQDPIVAGYVAGGG